LKIAKLSPLYFIGAVIVGLILSFILISIFIPDTTDKEITKTPSQNSTTPSNDSIDNFDIMFNLLAFLPIVIFAGVILNILTQL
jgi:hypothetical protein